MLNYVVITKFAMKITEDKNMKILQVEWFRPKVVVSLLYWVLVNVELLVCVNV